MTENEIDVALCNITKDLPNHKTELFDAERKIEKYKQKIYEIKKNEKITNKIHNQLYEEIIHILDWIGRMSNSVFNVRDELEIKYMLTYCNAPNLGNELFLKHYYKLHHPYSILKNRCFTLLEQLDEIYFNIHKKHPSNWNN